MRRLPYGAYGYRSDEKQRRRRRFWRRFGFSLLLLVEIGLFAGVLISVLSDIYGKMPAWEELECVTGRVPIIDKGIFGQSRAVSASCCVAFHSAYVQYASFKRLAGRRNGLCLTL